ncbi:protein big brother-like [Cylas formicarius]|uniref:protein big brother-like n=1 Tax=Cylas formicarius TaxID=197179 RepID=UPI002958A7AB|nr:protein big brother-like [Cylas formicarius]
MHSTSIFSFGSMYEPPRQRFIVKMPRVVPDQKSKFESDELFRRLSRESEVRFTGCRDRPQEERTLRFQRACREGHTEIAFASTGTNLQLVFAPPSTGQRSECDFEKESGKVHIRSSFIMNGVSVRWRGWIDLKRLDGSGCLEFDEERASQEDANLKKAMEIYNQKVRHLESKDMGYRQDRGQNMGLHNHSAVPVQRPYMKMF